jgi:hypothetical protein
MEGQREGGRKRGRERGKFGRLVGEVGWGGREKGKEGGMEKGKEGRRRVSGSVALGVGLGSEVLARALIGFG